MIYRIEWDRYYKNYSHTPFPNENLLYWLVSEKDIKVLQEIEKHPQFAILYLKSPGQIPYYIARNKFLKSIISGKIRIEVKKSFNIDEVK